MPFALILVGLLLVIAAVRDKLSGDGGLYTLVKSDFTGPNNYAYWLASILLIGAIGYIKPLQPLSRAFLVLLVVVLIVTHGGLFDKLNTQLFGGTLTPTQQDTVMNPLTSPVTLTPYAQGSIFGAGSIQSGNQ